MTYQADSASSNSPFELAQLPLIIAGPILRKTTDTSVTVWLALKHACHVELTVLATENSGKSVAQVVMKGDRQTVKLGVALHVVAVTASIYPHSPESNPEDTNAQVTQSDSSLQQPLQSGLIYAYDLSFRELKVDSAASTKLPSPQASAIALQDALRSPLFPTLSVSYFDHGLPTFSICPEKLEQLQLFHGSCRNVKDRGHDALPIVDCAAAHYASSPNQRPHQLLFTGDQIYGDEVADPFLWALLQAQNTLLGWKEPLCAGDRQSTMPLSEADLEPGQRSPLATEQAGLTASLKNTPEKASSHLFRFGEYCTTYLFAWSQCLWQIDFPQAEAMGYKGKKAQQWEQDRTHLNRNRKSQPLVRRILANVPTYMIFDDHDVSDDWNLNQAWCERVLLNPLGAQVVRNAMLAYGLFQGWGNTPEQFAKDTPGGALWETTEAWCGSGGQDIASSQEIAKYLGLPSLNFAGTSQPKLFRQEENAWVLNSSPSKLQWHYSIQGPCHQILVLDTRTQRGYPMEESSTAPPQLLSPSAFRQQLSLLMTNRSVSEIELVQEQTPKVTLIVAPTNVFTLKILDWLQSLALKMNRAFDADVGDSWNLDGASRVKLLTALFQSNQPVVILSGDIHFGSSLQVDYQMSSFAGAESKNSSRGSSPLKQGRLVQLTASAICNSETVTGLLHTKLKCLLRERSRRWLGWREPDIQIEVTSPLSTWLKRQWLQHYKRRKAPAQLSLEDRARLQPHSPDLRYGTAWLKRQPAKRPPWSSGSPPWLTPGHGRSTLHSNLTQRLWYNRWLQEGDEVVGFNNIGLVHFERDRSNAELQVIHDLYWYAPWTRLHIVYSRFKTKLNDTHYLKSSE